MNDLSEVVAPLLRHRRAVVSFAILLLSTLAYFVGPAAWNQNSRLALVRAMVEHGEIAIDEYHATTGDKSFRDGHYYSDKAPGASWLALPAYAGLSLIKRVGGGETPEVTVLPLDPFDAETGRAPAPEARQPGDRLLYNRAYRVALWLCGLSVSGLATVAGAAALWLLGLRFSGRSDAATLLALSWALGTLALPYGTALYGHQPCAAALLIGFALLILLPRPCSVSAAIACGACLGLAVCCEYPAALPVVAMSGWALAKRGPGFFGALVLGGLPWALALAAYHHQAFGSPLATGYDFLVLPEFADGMREHYGIRPPDPAVLYEIVFGRYRGLLPSSPVLLPAAFGLVLALVRGPAIAGGFERDVAALALGVVAYYLLLNAGYYMWDGGAAVGPRHVVPMLPFLCLGLVPAGLAYPWVVRTLAIASAGLMLVATAGAPEAPRYGEPLWQHAIFALIGGSTDPDPAGATNLGRLAGLPGAVSLVPLLLLWWWLWPQKRMPNATPAPERNGIGESAIDRA